MKSELTLQQYNTLRNRLLRQNRRDNKHLLELAAGNLSPAGNEAVNKLQARIYTREDIIDMFDESFGIPVQDELEPLTHLQ